MKLSIITDFYPPDILGGAEITASNIVKGLKENKGSVSVLTGFFNAECVENDIYRILPLYWHPHKKGSKLPFWEKLAIDIKSYRKAHNYLGIFQPDIILIISVRYVSFWAVSAGLSANIPTFYFAPDNWLAKRKRSCSEPGFLNKLRSDAIYHNFKFNKIICPSLNLLNEFMESGFSEQELTVLHHGVDTRLFSPQDFVKCSKQKKLLFVGRLHQIKGAHVAINALKELHRKGYSSLSLTIAGEGETEYIQRLKEETSCLGLSNFVFFIGKIDQTQLPDQFANAAIVLIPSIEESFGIVAIEAMSCARPLICSRVGGLKEIIDDGINGILIPPNNPNALARAIQKIIDEPQLAESMGIRAREKVVNNFSIDRFLINLVSIIEK